MGNERAGMRDDGDWQPDRVVGDATTGGGGADAGRQELSGREGADRARAAGGAGETTGAGPSEEGQRRAAAEGSGAEGIETGDLAGSEGGPISSSGFTAGTDPEDSGTKPEASADPEDSGTDPEDSGTNPEDSGTDPEASADPEDRESPYELLRRGQALAAKRHFAQAAIVLGRAARLEPRKGSILEALGRALYNSGQHERARETFERLLEIDPSSDYGHYALGQSLKQLGRRREARTHLRIAVALAPTSKLYAGALRRLGPPPGADGRGGGPFAVDWDPGDPGADEAFGEPRGGGRGGPSGEGRGGDPHDPE